jgi:hypothetical protein
VEGHVVNNALINIPFRIPINANRLYITDYNNSYVKVYGNDGDLDFIIGNVPSKNICVIYYPVPMPELIEQDSWIQEMSVAEAKILLGTIRGKFSSYSFGGGGTQTDGEQIKGDGKEAKQALLEDIKSRRRPLPMVQF